MAENAGMSEQTQFTLLSHRAVTLTFSPLPQASASPLRSGLGHMSSTP